MRAIKIDVEKREIYYVEVVTSNGSDVDSIHDLLGCECFCLGSRITNNYCYVDDNGLLRKPEEVNGGFYFKEHGEMLVGHGLICGCDAEGEAIPVTVTVEQVAPHVRWLDKEVILPYLL